MSNHQSNRRHGGGGGLLDKCKYVAPGQIGVCRKSMLVRETLQRPRTGTCRHRGHHIMPSDFTYGYKPQRVENEIQKCFNWPSDADYRQASNSDDFPRDFNRINVESVKYKIHPVPDWMAFADEKDYRLDPSKKVLGKLQKPVFPTNMTFGRLHRPGTPIACVMAHRYKTMWDDDALAANKKRMMALAQSKYRVPQPFETKASVLQGLPINARVGADKSQADHRQVKQAVDGLSTNRQRRAASTNHRSQSESRPGWWQMHRFRRIPPRLTTRWSVDDASRLGLAKRLDLCAERLGQ